MNMPDTPPKGQLPLKSPETPKKRYPLNPPSGNDHHYAIVVSRIHALVEANKEKDEVIAQMAGEAVALRRLNLSLRLLAIHGLIYRLDSLIMEELRKPYPNTGRIQRWSAEVGRLRISYETLKESKLKGGK